MTVAYVLSELATAIFWIPITAYAMLNTIFDYRLLGLSDHNLGQHLLFFAAIALHFLIIQTLFKRYLSLTLALGVGCPAAPVSPSTEQRRSDQSGSVMQ